MVTRVQTLTQRAGTCQPGFTMKTWLGPVFWKKKHQQLRNSLLQLCWTSALTRSTLVSFQMLQQLCRYFSLLKTLQNDAAGQKSQKRHYPHQHQNILKQHLKDFHIDMFHSIPKAAQAEELCRVGCIFLLQTPSCHSGGLSRPDAGFGSDLLTFMGMITSTSFPKRCKKIPNVWSSNIEHISSYEYTHIQ